MVETEVPQSATPGRAPISIQHLEIRSFGGFESLDLSFDSNVTVICGPNGAGKSTILRALGYLLSGLLHSYDAEINGSVRRERVSSKSESFFRAELPARIAGVFQFDGSERRAIIDILKEGDLRTTPLFNRSLQSRETAAMWQQRVERPLHVAFLTGRSIENQQSQADLVAEAISRKASESEGYRGWWNANSSIGSFAGWLATQHLIEQEDNTPNPALAMAQEVIQRLISRSVAIRYSFREKEIVLTFEDGEEKLANYLSDGERSLLALAGGLIARAHLLNGHLDGFQVASCPGIVLIDEVELHLHPGWQQRVMPQLAAAFPLVQFIVTTHSPAVLSTVPARSIRILGREGTLGTAETPTFSEGAEVQVLWDRVFGVEVRPPESELAVAVKRYDTMLEDGTWDTDEGRSVFQRIRFLSNDEDPIIGRYLGAQRLASIRSK
jgi:predicted ATP-binding protein involved in virulence